jgi:hypothetical protein
VLWIFIALNIHRLGRVRTPQTRQLRWKVTADFPDSAYQYKLFSDTVAIFYGRYLFKKKTIEITNFFVVVSSLINRFAVIVHGFELLLFIKYEGLHGHTV